MIILLHISKKFKADTSKKIRQQSTANSIYKALSLDPNKLTKVLGKKTKPILKIIPIINPTFKTLFIVSFTLFIFPAP